MLLIYTYIWRSPISFDVGLYFKYTRDLPHFRSPDNFNQSTYSKLSLKIYSLLYILIIHVLYTIQYTRWVPN